MLRDGKEELISDYMRALSERWILNAHMMPLLIERMTIELRSFCHLIGLEQIKSSTCVLKSLKYSHKHIHFYG